MKTINDVIIFDSGRDNPRRYTAAFPWKQDGEGKSGTLSISFGEKSIPTQSPFEWVSCIPVPNEIIGKRIDYINLSNHAQAVVRLALAVVNLPPLRAKDRVQLQRREADERGGPYLMAD